MVVAHEASFEARFEVSGPCGHPCFQLVHRAGELQRIEGIRAVHPATEGPSHKTEGIRRAAALDLPVAELDSVHHRLHKDGIDAITGQACQGVQDNAFDARLPFRLRSAQADREDHLFQVGLQTAHG